MIHRWCFKGFFPFFARQIFHVSTPFSFTSHLRLLVCIWSNWFFFLQSIEMVFFGIIRWFTDCVYGRRLWNIERKIKILQFSVDHFQIDAMAEPSARHLCAKFESFSIRLELSLGFQSYTMLPWARMIIMIDTTIDRSVSAENTNAFQSIRIIFPHKKTPQTDRSEYSVSNELGVGVIMFGRTFGEAMLHLAQLNNQMNDFNYKWKLKFFHSDK